MDLKKQTTETEYKLPRIPVIKTKRGSYISIAQLVSYSYNEVDKVFQLTFPHDITLTITKEQFNNFIKPYIDNLN